MKLLALVILCAVPARAAVYIARHAEKVATKMSEDPPLTEKGEKRAVDLARVLSHVPLKAVYVTEFRRTRLTAGPAAKAHGLKPVQVKLDETEALARTLRAEHLADDVLVVAHSDTIPALLKSLGAPGGPEEELASQEYDDLFIVDLSSSGTSLHWLRYGDAPAR